MRKHKHGSVEQYAPGKWRVRTRVDGKLRTVASDLTERRAHEYANALAHVNAQHSALTIGHLVETVKSERLRRDDLRPSTLRGERSIWVAIKTAFGDLHPSDLDRGDVKRWLETSTAASTRRNRLNALRYLFAYAMDRELVDRNPCDGVKPKGKRPKLSKADLLQKLLWPEQQTAIVGALLVPGRVRLSERPVDDEAKRMFLLACYLFAIGTGCRLSEMWGVKREDISPSGVLIRRSEGNEAPKSGDWREVPRLPATDAALDIMTRLRAAFPKLEKSEWLFPGWRGEQRGWNKQPKGWRETLEACKLGHRTWHWLRHTCATSLLAGWWSDAEEPIAWTLEAVQAMLGHASITTTEIYAKLLDDKAFEAARKAFQQRSRRDLVARVDYSTITESQLPDLNRRPAVYEAVDGTSSSAGFGGQALQAWNSRLAAARGRRRARLEKLADAGLGEARPGLAICRAHDAVASGDEGAAVAALAEAEALLGKGAA